MIILFWVAIGAIMLSVLYWTIKNGISPMPTTALVRRKLFQVLPEHVSGAIFELGSGWGTLAFDLAGRFPEATIVGYETSHIPYAVSRLLQLFYRRKNLRFVREDFFKIDLEGASVVVCYLYPGAMKRLKEKLEREAGSGMLVATHTFSIPGWKPVKVIELDDLYKTKIYIYILGSS